MPEPASLSRHEILELGRIAAGECEREDGETVFGASLRQFRELCHSFSVIAVPMAGIEIYTEMVAVSGHASPAQARTPDLSLLSRNPLSQLAQFHLTSLTSANWLYFSRSDACSERAKVVSFEAWAEALGFGPHCDTLSCAWKEIRPGDGAGITLFADDFLARDQTKCNVLGQMIANNPTSPIRRQLQRELDEHSQQCPANCSFCRLDQRQKLIAAGLRAGISDVDLACLFGKKGSEKDKLTPASIKKYRTRIRERIIASMNVLLPIADPLDAACPPGHHCRDRADASFAALWKEFSGEDIRAYSHGSRRCIRDWDPYAEGHSAALGSKPATANPYPPGNEPHKLWESGFHDGLVRS